MKKGFLLLALACVSLIGMQAQLLMDETFEFDPGRPLVMDPIASSDNFDGVTGWSTQSNSLAAEQRWFIKEGALSYPGYPTSEVGNALEYTPTAMAGQGLFKLWGKNFKNDSTFYMSFLINFANEAATGGDYLLGVKMEPSAVSTNWGCRFFTVVDPSFPGEEVTIGINKMSGGTTTFVNGNAGPFFPANQTLLVVIKYKVGVINGETYGQEAGKFDDVMSIFVNPPLDGVEPATPMLTHQDNTQNDMYRISSSGARIGGAVGPYLRSSVEGMAPKYLLDGLRVGYSWADVVPQASAISKVTDNTFVYFINNGVLDVRAQQGLYQKFEIVNMAGQKMLQGQFDGNQHIQTSTLSKGSYILRLIGKQQAAASIIL